MNLLADKEATDRGIQSIDQKVCAIDLEIELAKTLLNTELEIFSSLSVVGVKYRKQFPVVSLKRSPLRDLIKASSKSIDSTLDTISRLKAQRESVLQRKTDLESHRDVLNDLLLETR